MGILRHKGKLVLFNSKGFIVPNSKTKKVVKYYKKKQNTTKPYKKGKTNLLNDGWNWFSKTNKMNKVDKFEDLLETNNARKPTLKNIKWWKSKPKERDIIGIDSYNINKAQSLEPNMKDSLVESYIEGDGDIESFKTKDKEFRQSIKDEIYFERY